MDFGIQREFWNQSPIDTERQRYNAEGLVAQLNCDIYYKKKKAEAKDIHDAHLLS